MGNIVRGRSFFPPIRAAVASASGLVSSEYRRFFEQIWQRLYPLGIESSDTLYNGIVATTFATTDVDTIDNEITETGHPFETGMRCQFSTTGTLPGGLSASTDYWIINNGTNTYQVASSRQNALDGTPISLTSQGSGTHTVTPYARVEGLNFNFKGTSAAIVEFVAQRITTGGGAQELVEVSQHVFVYKPTTAAWEYATSPTWEDRPDDASLTFFITAEGQVEYQSTAVTGTASISKLTWRARTFQAKNTYSKVGYI